MVKIAGNIAESEPKMIAAAMDSPPVGSDMSWLKRTKTWITEVNAMEVRKATTRMVTSETFFTVTWKSVDESMPKTRLVARYAAANSPLAPMIRPPRAIRPIVNEPPSRFPTASSINSCEAGKR